MKLSLGKMLWIGTQPVDCCQKSVNELHARLVKVLCINDHYAKVDWGDYDKFRKWLFNSRKFIEEVN